MRRARQTVALMSLAALLAPFGSGAAVALHLALAHASHHHDAAADAAQDLRTVWHGHSHDKSTPEHDHPGISAQTAVSRGSATLLESPSSWHLVDYVASRVCAELRLSRSFAAGRTGAGPPTFSAHQTILRV